MCRPASFILTKDRVYWSEHTDSHEDIIREFNLSADDGAARVRIIRVEIAPPGDNFAAPLNEWQYRADQDILPEWADAPSDEARTRGALRDWVDYHIILRGKVRRDHGAMWLYGSSQATLRGSSRATLYGSSRATLCDSSEAMLCDSSQATLYGSSRATLCDSSEAMLCGSSQATLRGSSRATLYDSSRATLYGAALVFDRTSANPIIRFRRGEYAVEETD